jgi:hypothetical protein
MEGPRKTTNKTEYSWSLGHDFNLQNNNAELLTLHHNVQCKLLKLCNTEKDIKG